MNKNQKNLYIKQRSIVKGAYKTYRKEIQRISRIARRYSALSTFPIDNNISSSGNKSYNHLINIISKIKSPTNFSIRENLVETIAFCDDVYSAAVNKKQIEMDFSDVQNITIDALLYLLATHHRLMRNNISFNIRGNTPNDKVCNDLFTKTGFLDYWNNNIEKVTSNDCVRIRHGDLVTTETIREICLFTQEKLKVDRMYTRPLFNVINELMSNTVDHAYPEQNTVLTDWYLYAEYIQAKNVVNFAFLDIGEGIPITIQKKFGEKFRHYVGLAHHSLGGDIHGQLIMAALKGFKDTDVVRSQTGMVYRGKGLPRIFEIYNSEKISDLYILSRRGEFSNMQVSDNNMSLKGTFISWSIGG